MPSKAEILLAQENFDRTDAFAKCREFGEVHFSRFGNDSCACHVRFSLNDPN